MLVALESLRGEHDFYLTQVDVDADPVAEAKYDELVPVLTDATGQEICHYYLDLPKVLVYLASVQCKLS
jgi:thioredoxin reductase (NADPH)